MDDGAGRGQEYESAFADDFRMRRREGKGNSHVTIRVILAGEGKG